MGVHDIQLRAAFGTAARRDAVRDAIVTRIQGRPRWGIDEIEVGPITLLVDGVKTTYPNGLFADFRFTSRLDADDLRSRVEGFATGQRQPLPGSYVEIHLCRHDEEEGLCDNPDIRRDW